MVLTVHHLGISQSERIVWLCEELGLDYDLKLYQRSPVLSPPEYLALHPLGAAPVIQDGDLTLAESGACLEYIIHIHGAGKLTVQPGAKHYADYLYWLHFGNGTLQPAVSRAMVLKFTGLPDDNSMRVRVDSKQGQMLQFLNQRLGATKAWLAGDEFTAADIMVVFSLTTMRKFFAIDLSEYEAILAYLQRVGGREAYQRAMAKGDPGLDVPSILLGPPPPPFEGVWKR
ncbi:hypothetical protein LTR36_004677 [Oleoguttula mirabilis]|uniref:Glutathione S-transferase n=1 Tax=Oleoguttula mirabilis TaxID=1507867 RepID=A0AAV9JF75_9PEZI|nr:hypothetical protein LTR36_004677 [Oleoguttula mirabilis]